MRWSQVLFLPLPPISEQEETPISVIPALPHPTPFVLTQTLHYSASEELNCSEQSLGEQQVSPTSTSFVCAVFWCEKTSSSSSGTLNQTSSVLEAPERAHTDSLSSHFAVQPRLAGDSCLQLSVITFYLLRRYLWMWDKSLDSDPLYFYYLQDGIRAGLLRTGYTATVWVPPDVSDQALEATGSTTSCLLHPPG